MTARKEALIGARADALQSAPEGGGVTTLFQLAVGPLPRLSARHQWGVIGVRSPLHLEFLERGDVGRRMKEGDDAIPSALKEGVRDSEDSPGGGGWDSPPARPPDTLFLPLQTALADVVPFPGFRNPTPKVFASVFPVSPAQFVALRRAGDPDHGTPTTRGWGVAPHRSR